MEDFRKKTLWLLGLGFLLVFLYMAQEALVVVFTAFIFASALLPWVERLDRWMPRWVAVLIPFILLSLVGVVVVLPVSTLALQQLQTLISDLPGYLEQLRQSGDDLAGFIHRYPILANLHPERLMEQMSPLSPQVFSGFTGATVTVSKVALNLLTALIISFFLLLDREKIQRYSLRLAPPRDQVRLSQLIDHLTRSTGAFVNGQLLFMVSFGTFIAAGLSVIGLPFAILFGILSGLLTIIPIIGPNIAMLPALAVGLMGPDGVVTALWVLILFIGVQAIENNIIGPLIMGRAVGLHPLAIILAILVGGLMFGMLGIILAIPVASCLNIILEEWVLKSAEPGEACPLPSLEM